MYSSRVPKKYFQTGKLTPLRNKIQMLKKNHSKVNSQRLKRLKYLLIRWTLTYKQNKWNCQIIGLQEEVSCLKEVDVAQNSINHPINNMRLRQDLSKMKIVRSALIRNRQTLPCLQLILEPWIPIRFIHKIYLWGQDTRIRRKFNQNKLRKKRVRYQLTSSLLKTSLMSGWMEPITRKSLKFKLAKALEKSLF